MKPISIKGYDYNVSKTNGTSLLDMSNKEVSFNPALEFLKEWRFNALGIKTFLLSSIVIYILISLPTMLGIGYVIDWVPEATELQNLRDMLWKDLQTTTSSKL